MKSLIAVCFVSIAVALPANASVCERSEGVRLKLEEVLGKNCSQITATDLAQVHELKFYWYSIRLSPLRSGDFSGLVNLETLIIGDQKLLPPVLPADIFAGLRSLRYLYLRNNALTDLHPQQFRGLSSLETLVLSLNNFSRLPEGLFAGLTRLRKLNLHSNRSLLHDNPDVFADLTNLEELILSSNGEIAVKAFTGLANLRHLEVGYTALADGVSIFHPLRGLERIHADHCGLRSLVTEEGSPFAGMQQLRYLSLSENELTEIPATAFAHTPAMRDLRLDYNSLQTLPLGLFDGMPELVLLNLQVNQISSLPPGIFDGTFQGRYGHVSLNFNPLPATEVRRLREELGDRAGLYTPIMLYVP